MPRRTKLPTISLTPIERPVCPHCDVRMTLVRAERRPLDCEARMFVCCKCELKREVFLPADPMRSPAVNWINSNLKPPE